MANDDEHSDKVRGFYDTHPINEAQILAQLERDGIDLKTIMEEDLEHYDQDHYGGVEAVDRLAQLTRIDDRSLVLDVCSGLGGPARHIAATVGCQVIGIDLTDSRVVGAGRLTELAGLEKLVSFRQANALHNPFPDGTFDALISQEAFAHIPDKPRLISECVRVLKPGGRLAFTDILVLKPLDDITTMRLKSGMTLIELATHQAYRDLLGAQACDIETEEDLSAHWAEILSDRLDMYRSMRDHTIATFGQVHYDLWDGLYRHFVTLFERGVLGGARFGARKRD